MFTSELEYFRQRAQEERERAKTAPASIVAEVHIALAERYEAAVNDPHQRAALGLLWRSHDASSLPLRPENLGQGQPLSLSD